PAISVGRRATVLRSGMPSEAAGPVLATVTPTLICADAISGSASASAPVSTDSRMDCFRFIVLSPCEHGSCLTGRRRLKLYSNLPVYQFSVSHCYKHQI